MCRLSVEPSPTDIYEVVNELQAFTFGLLWKSLLLLASVGAT